MKVILFSIYLLLLIILSNAVNVYNLDLIIYPNDSAELVSIGIKEGESGPFPSAGNDNYHFEIFSKDNHVLFNQSFELNFFAYRFRGPNSTQPDVVPLNQSRDIWNLPYSKDASIIQLFHEDKKIWEYNVEYLHERVTPEKPISEPTSPALPLALAAVCLVLIIIAVVLYFLFRKKAK